MATKQQIKGERREPLAYLKKQADIITTHLRNIESAYTVRTYSKEGSWLGMEWTDQRAKDDYIKGMGTLGHIQQLINQHRHNERQQRINA